MISIITDPAVGGTFLNWSIHYLAGDTEYYSAWSDSVLPVCNDPLTDKNAHGFVPNQICTLAEFNIIVPKITQSLNPNDSIYFHHFRGSFESIDHDTAQAVSRTNEITSKNIFLTLAPEHALYKCSHEKRAVSRSWADRNIVLHTKEEILNDFLDRFFLASKIKWQEQKLDQTWDLREFLALNVDPFNIQSMRPMIGMIKSSYVLEAVELMTVFDQTVYNLFDYLQIKLCSDRFDHWLPVYQRWQTLHRQRLRFVFNYQLIVDSVINGYDCDLSRFDLDIVQEAAIQRALIYQHGLNLKTWQLEKFVNTAQLHALLEPNFHPL